MMEAIDPLAVVVCCILLGLLLFWAFVGGAGACYLWFHYTLRPRSFLTGNRRLRGSPCEDRVYKESHNGPPFQKIEDKIREGNESRKRRRARKFLRSLDPEYVKESVEMAVQFEGMMKKYGVNSFVDLVRILQDREANDT